MTNKTFKLPGGKLYVIASVFPTDESMASAHGADSVQLGIALASNKLAQAFAASHYAVAEVSFNTFDTARVQSAVRTGNRRLLLWMECWDSTLEKQK